MSRVAKDGITVEAQEYGVKHWLRPGSIGRGVSEFLFKDYQGVMERLRVVDEDIRAIALGRGGEGQPDISVVYAIKQAKAAFRDNRLIDALYYASLIDIIARNVIGRASPLVEEVRKEVYKQYARYNDPKAMQYMRNLEQKEAQKITNEIIVNAQVLQGLYRTIMRGDPLSRSWESEVNKFKTPVQNVITEAEKFATLLLASFDRMGIARASGKIGDWTAEIGNLSKLQPNFNKEVRKAFEAIKPLMEAAKTEGIAEEGQQVQDNYIYDAMMNVYKGDIPVVSEEEEIPVDVEEPEEEVEVEETPDQSAAPAPEAALEPVPEATVPAGEPTKGVPVEQGVKPTEPTPQPARPARRGPGRPTREERSKEKELAQFEALRKKLLETEEPEKAPEQVAAPEPTPATEPELAKAVESEPEVAPEPLDFQAGMDYLDTLDPEQKEAAAKVLLAASQNSEDKDLFDDDGVVIGSVKGGIITVSDTDLVVDVATAEKLLAYMEKAKLVEPDITPAITEEEIAEPAVEEPVAESKPAVEPEVAPEKQSEPVNLEEVDSGDGEPDRAIIFTNANPTDQRVLKSLSKVLGKDVSVVSTKDRESVKSSYPKAQFFTYGDEPQDGETSISRDILSLLSGHGRMGTDKKNKILELLGMPVKPVAPKPAPAKPVSKPKPPVAKSEPKPVAKTEYDEDKPVVINPGTAKVSNVTASVNENTENFLQRSASVPLKEADIAVILLQLSKEFVVTGTELEAAQAALKSFFNKDFVLLADRQLAISRIDGLEKSGKKVAVFMWQRSDFRSAINITKEKAPEAEITASVENAVIKLANTRFFNQLKKAAEFNDPYLLARMMLQYSEAMEDKDPQLSINLLAKAQEILDV